MPKPYPKEFREDVVRVARSREPGVRIKDVAKDLGITESCLTNWLSRQSPVRWWESRVWSSMWSALDGGLI